jgi:hypothetical protein
MVEDCLENDSIRSKILLFEFKDDRELERLKKSFMLNDEDLLNVLLTLRAGIV